MKFRTGVYVASLLSGLFSVHLRAMERAMTKIKVADQQTLTDTLKPKTPATIENFLQNSQILELIGNKEFEPQEINLMLGLALDAYQYRHVDKLEALSLAILQAKIYLTILAASGVDDDTLKKERSKIDSSIRK